MLFSHYFSSFSGKGLAHQKASLTNTLTHYLTKKRNAKKLKRDCRNEGIQSQAYLTNYLRYPQQISDGNNMVGGYMPEISLLLYPLFYLEQVFIPKAGHSTLFKIQFSFDVTKRMSKGF